MIYFILGFMSAIILIIILGIVLFFKFKNKLNPLKKLEKEFTKEIEDKNAFSSFFGGK